MGRLKFQVPRCLAIFTKHPRHVGPGCAVQGTSPLSCYPVNHDRCGGNQARLNSRPGRSGMFEMAEVRESRSGNRSRVRPKFPFQRGTSIVEPEACPLAARSLSKSAGITGNQPADTTACAGLKPGRALSVGRLSSGWCHRPRVSAHFLDPEGGD